MYSALGLQVIPPTIGFLLSKVIPEVEAKPRDLRVQSDLGDTTPSTVVVHRAKRIHGTVTEGSPVYEDNIRVVFVHRSSFRHVINMETRQHPGVRGDTCPGAMALMSQAEQCLAPLSQPTNATLVGGMTAESWKQSCRLYNESLRCVRNIVKKCHDSEVAMDMGRSMLTALRTGMGQLCENNHTFQRYLKHAECYAKQDASVRCVKKFSSDVTDVLAMDTDDADESTEKMCSSYHELIMCVNKIIESNCGRDAAELFDNLIKAQVPSHVSALCNLPPMSTRTTAYQSAVCRMAPTLLSSFFSVLLTAQYLIPYQLK
ncbi:hypothetical protein LSAT2_003857 [Lamellibrachia satsuma]|nr:hypothetical protein LSAT2_003857 [Lamellibrachia satsuma]